MPSPINRMIDSAVRCVRCGTQGFMKCDCWERCSCGHFVEKGKPCRNLATQRCSTKIKYGKRKGKAKQGVLGI
jgi:hypothetical protein